MSIRILAVGSPMRGDDTAGLVLAERLSDARPEGCLLTTMPADALAMIEQFAGDPVVIIDAFEAGPDDPPVLKLDLLTEELPEEMSYSSHGLGVAQAVAMARSMGMLPPHLTLIGIAGYRFGMGDEPSDGFDERLAEAEALLDEELALLREKSAA
jgi:hydrogenase maturation protease